MQVDPARVAARSLGQTTYMSVEACRRGHYAPRYTSNGACLACAGVAGRGAETLSQRHENLQREIDQTLSKLTTLANAMADLEKQIAAAKVSGPDLKSAHLYKKHAKLFGFDDFATEILVPEMIARAAEHGYKVDESELLKGRDLVANLMRAHVLPEDVDHWIARVAAIRTEHFAKLARAAEDARIAALIAADEIYFAELEAKRAARDGGDQA